MNNRNEQFRPVSGFPGPTSAPGANWSYDIPQGEIWEIYAVKLKLTCDANVANRYANFRYTDSTPYIHIQSGWSAAITASSVVIVIAANWPTYYFDLANHTIHLPFPFPLRIPAGKTLGFVFTGIQATDQLSESFITAAKIPFDMS